MRTFIEQGDTFVTEWTWVGTNTGPLVLRDGNQVSPTGKRVELRGMELARMRDGKICVLHMYWDATAIVQQLAYCRSAPAPDVTFVRVAGAAAQPQRRFAAHRS